MKKMYFLITIVLSAVLFTSSLDALIKVENLDDALKNEEITKNYEELYKNEDQVNVYLFYEKGDIVSREFLNYINEIYSQYGHFFELKVYEVSNNKDNKVLMSNTIDYLKASNIVSTPLIIIGDAYIVTFNDNVKKSFLSSIIDNYRISKNNRTDKIEEVLVRYYRNDGLMISIVVVSIATLIGLMIFARTKGKKIDE